MYAAAVRGADPEAAVSRALAGAPLPERVWIIAMGKAAVPMARGAIGYLQRAGRPAAGGIVVAPRTTEATDLPFPVVSGSHPLPDSDSTAAAEAIGALIARIEPGSAVRVLLSGGASSLVGAPVTGISLRALRETFRAISRKGLDIAAANVIRRRFLRWGGGRLAAALRHADVQVLAISDVPGDDAATIGSGPCLPDPLSAAEVRERMLLEGLLEQLPAEVAQWIDRACIGQEPETPKPQEFSFPLHDVILRNADALRAIADEARRRNYFADVIGTIEGEARDVGAGIGARLRESTPGSCLLWGGESTVTLGGSAGRGGRSQELALAAAQELAGSRAALLAAGTDGRDGPTDAAGAVVDGTTAEKLRAASVDVAAALSRHDTYPALEAAGALFRPGPTGTNVMDVVIGLCPR
ncbi:MAG TPA: DUF4147 domain-containing protein [Gemmatimonadales bacterium]|nr:DUF4147 domain-containing protein [Gemmatimonadales bacterium]